jgi:superfamily II DNA or RNA helicase
MKAACRSPEGRLALAGWHTARRIVYFPSAKAEILRALLDRHRKNKILVFTADTATAYAIARRFLIMAITSDIKRKEREDVMNRFRDGRIRGLVSCRVLNEGVDVPDAEIAIIVGGTQGEREQIQRMGRCLRPRDDKKAIVYELIARNTLEIRHWQKRTRTLAPRITTQI